MMKVGLEFMMSQFLAWCLIHYTQLGLSFLGMEEKMSDNIYGENIQP